MIEWIKWTDATLRYMPRTSRLGTIVISGADGISAEGIASLADLQGLHTLRWLTRDEDLLGVRKLTELKALDLQGLDISDDGMQHLAGLPALEELVLNGTAVTSAGLEHVAQGLPELESIVYIDSVITVPVIDALNKMPKLRQLGLLARFDEESWSKLASLQEVRELNLSKCEIPNRDLSPLLQLTKIQMLDLDATNLEREDIDRLHEELPFCTIHWQTTTIPAKNAAR